MGRPGSALDNAVIESWHSTLEFELRSLEQFATKAAARGQGQRMDPRVQPHPPALGLPVALCSPGGWRDAKGPAGLAGRALAGVGSGVLLFEDALEGVVLGRVVGGAGLPAAPDDVDPGAGQDAHGVRVVFAAGAGVVVEGRGPGAGVA